MTVCLHRDEVERLKAVVNQRMGLHFDDARSDRVAEVLAQRISATGASSATHYLRRLQQPEQSTEELRALAEQLTVGETYFFRNREHFQAITDTVLPARIEARRDERVLRLLSAGCSSGDEAYSLAIVLLERFPELSSWDVSILGVDINPAALRKAEQGRYTAWSLRQTPDPIRKAWFRQQGRELLLSEGARAAVTFHEWNLVGPSPLWRCAPFDLVLCRNVMMYFDSETTRSVVGDLANVIAPRGFLFLGHAENLRGVSTDFHLCHTNGTFYYRRRDQGETDHRPEDGGMRSQSGPKSGRGAGAPDQSWVEIINQASDRVALLTGKDGTSGTDRTLGTATPTQPPDGRSIAVRTALAFDLLRAERFGEALELLEDLPEAQTSDPDMQLLRAVLMLNSGAREEAERACREILARDELNAGAHYLFALSREQEGDRKGAMDHDQIAAYLDPAFAMPRLHMGLFSRRAGELAEARRLLERALELLAREDSSRILLFGGGFSRAALEQLCRAELRGCGGGR